MACYGTELPDAICDLIIDFLVISECRQKKLMSEVLTDINIIREIVLEGENYPIRDIVDYINVSHVRIKLMDLI